MNIDQLRYFVTVAQLENLSKAAEVLYVNQPTLSKNIGKLEQELGTELFERKGKKLMLNSQGERFLEYASKILKELELAETQISQMKSNSHERIRIGAAGCMDDIIALAAEFRKLDQECAFEFDFSIEEQEKPDINDYDVLIYPEGVKYEKYEGFDLGVEKCSLAVLKNHPLAGNSTVSVKQLSGLDYIFCAKGKFYTEFSHRVITALKIPVNSVCFTDSRQSQIQMIKAGMAAGIIPGGSSAGFFASGIKLIPIDSKHFTRRMKICFKRDKHLSDPARRFKLFITEKLGIKGDHADGSL